MAVGFIGVVIVIDPVGQVLRVGALFALAAVLASAAANEYSIRAVAPQM